MIFPIEICKWASPIAGILGTGLLFRYGLPYSIEAPNNYDIIDSVIKPTPWWRLGLDGKRHFVWQKLGLAFLILSYCLVLAQYVLEKVPA